MGLYGCDFIGLRQAPLLYTTLLFMMHNMLQKNGHTFLYKPFRGETVFFRRFFEVSTECPILPVECAMKILQPIDIQKKKAVFSGCLRERKTKSRYKYITRSQSTYYKSPQKSLLQCDHHALVCISMLSIKNMNYFHTI